MSTEFEQELAADLDDVFFNDSEFATGVVLQRTGQPCSVIVSPGITRVVSDRYLKSNFEVRAKASDELIKGDILQLQGAAAGTGYRLGDPIERDTQTVLYFAEKTK